MRTRLIGTVLALALLIGLPPARSGAGGQTGELGAAIPAQPLPIVDLHFHAEDGWDRDALVQRFDQLGVARAGNGAEGADSLALEFADAYPGRFIPFIGERALNRLVLNEREGVWDLTSPAALRYLDEIEAGLRSRRFAGIGELLPNHENSHPPGALTVRYLADVPLVQRLWALSAAYHVPLSVHMEAWHEDMAAMERLLDANQDGIWIWAHTGQFAEPPLLRPLLQAHPNLYGELSTREGISRLGITTPIVDADGRLLPEWKGLLEEFPDRFMIGTDPSVPDLDLYAALIGAWRAILAQLSSGAAAGLAHLNAERLLALRDAE